MIKLEKVRYRYASSDTDILQGVNADFDEGVFYTIVGPSGVGKTTLLSILAGLDRPSAGSVYLQGNDLSSMNLDLYRREKIAMVFQAYHLFPLLTALENTSYLLEAKGVSRREAEARATQLLSTVGIAGTKQERFPSNLSGGEQQRVAIARALSTGARVILADEPTGNLDTANGEAIVSLLQNLAHHENYCVIVVTHNLDIAARSDVVLRMSDGYIVTHDI